MIYSPPVAGAGDGGDAPTISLGPGAGPGASPHEPCVTTVVPSSPMTSTVHWHLVGQSPSVKMSLHNASPHEPVGSSAVESAPAVQAHGDTQLSTSVISPHVLSIGVAQ